MNYMDFPKCMQALSDNRAARPIAGRAGRRFGRVR
ncbi:hypothetical protein BVI2075_230110 [Burkholderia vietnamiensis]|nr:hypothetical protein BVI2075_230110 [Burkholderia vietnamiensis]